MDEITQKLAALGESDYADFTAKLTPGIGRERILGVRIPALRTLAKSVVGTPEAEVFLRALPHYYLDENNLHGALLSLEKKDILRLLAQTEEFLPHIDNWATCDLFSPKLFAKYPGLVYENISRWLGSAHTYTLRFAVISLLGFYMGENWRPEHATRLAELQSREYYVNMALAWYFSEAVARRPDEILPYFERRLITNPWVHNKAIQKSRESLRVGPELGEQLRSLKI